MAKSLPAGFNADRIIAGLHKAMEFGAPTRTEDQATFYVVEDVTDDGVAVDEEGVPFDPDQRRETRETPHVVPCAIELMDLADRTEGFGPLRFSRAEITLLDAEYQQVRGFAHVVIGGDRYFYVKTEPPVALGSIDVWTVHVSAEDDR